MSVTLNVVVIGTGFGSIVHVPAYDMNHKYNLVGIFGHHSEKANDIAHKYGIKVYPKLQDIAEDKNVDLVSIASIVSEHYSNTKMFIGNKKNIILEKPMALNSKESLELMELAEIHGVHTAICHEHKYDSSWQYVKKLIQDETYGKMRSIDFKYSFTYWNSTNSSRKFDWFSVKELGGGIIGGHLAHVLDLLNFIDDSKIKEISGKGFVEVPFHYDKDNQLRKQTAADTVNATVIMNSGIPAYINLSAARCDNYKKTIIYTEMAKIEISGQNDIAIYDNNGQFISHPIPPEFVINDYQCDFRLNSFMKFIDDFHAKYYENQETLITDFTGGHKIQEMLDLLANEG